MMSANLRLKVLWLKNCLGLSIDQVSLKSQLPITFYYFWPRTEAWEQLKLEQATAIAKGQDKAN